MINARTDLLLINEEKGLTISVKDLQEIPKEIVINTKKRKLRKWRDMQSPNVTGMESD